MKTHDYINRVVITLLLTVYEGTWTNTLPSRCYAITMILRVRRKFFEITTFPNNVSRHEPKRMHVNSLSGVVQEEVPVVKDFPNVFKEELPGMPPD